MLDEQLRKCVAAAHPTDKAQRIKMIDLSAWQGKDPLTLNEAAYLWVGIPPNLSWKTLKEKYPEQKASAFEIGRQIREKAEAGEIEHERPSVEHIKSIQVPVDSGVLAGRSRAARTQTITTKESGPVSWDKALFSRDALRAYADSIGQRPSFLFSEAVAVGALRCLDKTHPHFSQELEAAVLAWQYASERSDGSKKKPKALIDEYLTDNWKGSAEAKKRIATLANWNKTTGPKAT